MSEGRDGGRIRIVHFSTLSKDLQPAREPRNYIRGARYAALAHERSRHVRSLRSRDENPYARGIDDSSRRTALLRNKERPCDGRDLEKRRGAGERKEKTRERERKTGRCSVGFSLDARRAYQAFLVAWVVSPPCEGSGIEVTVGAKVNLEKPD